MPATVWEDERVSQMLSGHSHKRKLYFPIIATALNLQQETSFLRYLIYKSDSYPSGILMGKSTQVFKSTGKKDG